MKIALDYFREHEPDKLAQIYRFRPDFEWPLEQRCRKCGGQVLRDYEELKCLQCGAEHDKEGNLIDLIEPAVAVGINTQEGPRLPTKRKVR